MNLKRLTAILTGTAIAAAMTAIPVSAAGEVTVETGTLTASDVGILLGNGSINFTDGTVEAYKNKTSDEGSDAIIARLMDNDKETLVGYGNNDYFVIDLTKAKQSDKYVTGIKLYGINNACSVGLTNNAFTQFGGSSKADVDFVESARDNSDWSYKAADKSLDITKYKTTANGSYYDCVFVGNDIGRYNYIVIHTNVKNGNYCQLTEVELTYRSALPADAAASAPNSDYTLGYYSDLKSAVDAVYSARSTIQTAYGISVFKSHNTSNSHINLSDLNGTIKSGSDNTVTVTIPNGNSIRFTTANRTYNFDRVNLSNVSEGYYPMVIYSDGVTVNYSNGTITGRVSHQDKNVTLNLNNSIVTGSIVTAMAYRSDNENHPTCTLNINNSTVNETVIFNSSYDIINLTNSNVITVDNADDSNFKAQTTNVTVLDPVTNEGKADLEALPDTITDKNLATPVYAEFTVPEKVTYQGIKTGETNAGSRSITNMSFTSPTVTWEIEYAEDVGKTKRSITSSAEAETLTYNKGVEVDKTNNKIGAVFTGVALNKANFKATVTLTGGGSAVIN